MVCGLTHDVNCYFFPETWSWLSTLDHGLTNYTLFPIFWQILHDCTYSLTSFTMPDQKNWDWLCASVFIELKCPANIVSWLVCNTSLLYFHRTTSCFTVQIWEAEYLKKVSDPLSKSATIHSWLSKNCPFLALSKTFTVMSHFSVHPQKSHTFSPLGMMRSPELSALFSLLCSTVNMWLLTGVFVSWGVVSSTGLGRHSLTELSCCISSTSSMTDKLFVCNLPLWSCLLCCTGSVFLSFISCNNLCSYRRSSPRVVTDLSLLFSCHVECVCGS